MAQLRKTKSKRRPKTRGTYGKACAAIYNRVSTNGQDPETAMDDLHDAAVQRGFDVALAIAETGSGSRNDRPGLQRVLDAARRGKVSAVLVSRLDLFGRSNLDLLHNIRALTAAGVEFISIEQGLHVKPNGGAMSQLLLTVLSGVVEFGSSTKTPRTWQASLGHRSPKHWDAQLRRHGDELSRSEPAPFNTWGLHRHQ